jgi:hypothetical protein
MKLNLISAMVSLALSASALPAMAEQGPSTTTAPYMLSIAPDVNFTSILTTGDQVNRYKMGGIPDGLGAFDNDDDRTFTVVMNHELFASSGVLTGTPRAHGAKGAYVSKWVIDKRTLEVLSGEDLIKRVVQFDPVSATWVPVPAEQVDSAGKEVNAGKTAAFARFCSANLASQKAFSHRGKGTRHRIFMNGEESNPTYQRGLAHVVTGPDAGTTYVLPWAASANASWENLLANPHSGERTVVIGNSDGGTNGVYVYVGNKTNEGNDVERAGLVNGTLFRVAVNGAAAETRAADAGLGLTLNARGNYAGTFSLVAGADATNAASTKFQRPEDGSWDRKNLNRYYFVTTDQMDAAKDGNINPDIAVGQVGRSRLWALNFTDASQPELGGTIEMLLDGTTARGDYQMFDNITVNEDGSLILQEDVGANQHNGKMWRFNPATGELVKLAGFDPLLFGDIGAVGLLTKDEETSGVIDVTELLDRDDDLIYSLFVVQNHALSSDPELVEGGQLVLMSQPSRRKDDDREHKNDEKRDK